MKKLYITLSLLFVAMLIFVVYFTNKTVNDETNPSESISQDTSSSVENPASAYCETQGGLLTIVTQEDGSQFGLCKLDDYSCEEWAYLNGECTIDDDSEKIKQALIDKGLTLDGMKIVIYTHLGNYIEAGVVPVSTPGGGGYVFAAKEDGNITIVADGNGAILCNSFDEYPDFPTYLVSECIDEQGNAVSR